MTSRALSSCSTAGRVSTASSAGRGEVDTGSRKNDMRHVGRWTAVARSLRSQVTEIRMALLFRVICAALLPFAFVAAAHAQSYPTQTIRIVVAYAPGGTGDIVARLIAVPLAAALGQNVVVENRAGATGAIGTQSVVAAPPDGHTLLLGQTGEISINQHWIKGLSYDTERDLQPIALASVVPLALVVSSRAPYANMDDLAKVLSERKPVTFASAGTGTPGHFAGEFLK